MNIAAHECAHAIAHLADEYITCTEKDPLKSQVNQGTEAERAAGALAWKGLALPAELSPSGGFVAQHLHGDPMFTTATGYMGPIEISGLREIWARSGAARTSTHRSPPAAIAGRGTILAGRITSGPWPRAGCAVHRIRSAASATTRSGVTSRP